jgi:hypothetical protein
MISTKNNFIDMSKKSFVKEYCLLSNSKFKNKIYMIACVRDVNNFFFTRDSWFIKLNEKMPSVGLVNFD